MNITQEFYIVILDRSFAKLFNIFFNKINFFIKTSNTKFLYTKVWFTDQTFKLCKMEDRQNFNLVINRSKYIFKNTASDAFKIV